MLGNLKAIDKRSLGHTTCGKTTSLGQKASHNIDTKTHVNNGVTKTFSYRQGFAVLLNDVLVMEGTKHH
jgi:hypothetical protein